MKASKKDSKDLAYNDTRKSNQRINDLIFVACNLLFTLWILPNLKEEC
jgi:hypothetical protein